jgi:hypothetical protein
MTSTPAPRPLDLESEALKDMYTSIRRKDTTLGCPSTRRLKDSTIQTRHVLLCSPSLGWHCRYHNRQLARLRSKRIIPSNTYRLSTWLPELWQLRRQPQAITANLLRFLSCLHYLVSLN